MHEHVDQGSRARFDSTLALRADPYRFIGRQCALAGRDLFATRVLLKRTICVTGAAAAEVFYDPERFERPVPPPTCCERPSSAIAASKRWTARSTNCARRFS